MSKLEDNKIVKNKLENLQMILLCKKRSHDDVMSMENTGTCTVTAAQPPEELNTQDSCAVHLQQPPYHSVCRAYRLCQHAGPHQNGREQLANDESQV